LLRESLTSVASGCNTRVGILFYRSRLEFEIEPK
jgi:hypothetical protein